MSHKCRDCYECDCTCRRPCDKKCSCYAVLALSMHEFLTAYTDGINGRQRLLDAGHHPNAIWAKAEKANRKGYVDSGVRPDMCWLTPKGLRFIGEEEAE